jgi:two-component system, chemotaxis family, chemotaxis protein CheY
MHSFLTAHLRILIADSDSHMLGVLHSLLATIGIRHITSVRNSDRALSEIMRDQFDAILMADNLRPTDAIDLTRIVRATNHCANQRTPVILIADRAELSFIEMARDAGISEFIRKPITGKIVQQRLVSVLENPRDFIAEDAYTGPDRRRREVLGIDENEERRQSRKKGPRKPRSVGLARTR